MPVSDPDAAQEIERLRRRIEHTEQWYAVRWERLRDEFKGTEVWGRMATIMANGTADAAEPPTYAQQLNMLRHEVERLRAMQDTDHA